MSALHCGRVLALTRGNAGKIRKVLFSDPMALEDKALVLQRNLSPTDRQQATRSAKFAAEIENLYETAGRLKAKLENCYVKIKRYTVRVAAEEKRRKSTVHNKNPKRKPYAFPAK